MAGFRMPETPREQMVLWAQRLEDALPADHPVRQVDFLLRTESFATVFADWATEYVLIEGQPPYHPRDLTALYIYGMLNRLRSSRQLEQACYNRLDVIWLMSGQHPDHSTIHDFLSKPENARRVHAIFREVVFAGKRAGLIKGEHVNVDGTKIEANAGRGSVHKESSIEAALAKVDEQIAALQAEYEANEAREAGLLGGKTPWVPEAAGGSIAQRQAKLKRQQEQLKKALAAIARRREEVVAGPAPKAIASVTDPDSRVMRDKEGRRKPNYNSQLATDTAEGMILATAVNDAAEDSGQASPMLSRVQENTGQLPPVASVDSQYNTGPELHKLEEMGVTTYMPDNGQPESPRRNEAQAAALAAAQAGETLTDAQWEALPKEGKQVSKVAFTYDAAQDHYRCPMGQVLSFVHTNPKKTKGGMLLRRQYGGCPACAQCPRASMCCQNPRRGRTVYRDQYEECRERLRARMRSEEGRARYKLRGQTIEPRFGLIKYGLGVRRFLRRGLAAVRVEWELVATVVNVGILLRHWDQVRAVL